MVARKEGSTRSFPQYNIMKTALASFHDSLMSFDGSNRSSTEGMQIAVDASKFLAFSNDSKFSWNYLLDKQKIYTAKTEDRSCFSKFFPFPTLATLLHIFWPLFTFSTPNLAPFPIWSTTSTNLLTGTRKSPSAS